MRIKLNIFRHHGVLFALSLLLAAGGAYGARSWLQQQARYYEQKYTRQEALTQVVVPQRPLRAGDVLSSDMLSLREIPAHLADSNALTEVDYQDALGQQIRFDVDSGKPLLWAHLQRDVTETFSRQVPAGQRAMTVRVDDVNSLSGFLQPGDHIDLLLSYRTQQVSRIRPVVQNLQVLATGSDTLSRTGEGNLSGNFATITVQVTPLDASRITLAQQLGSLTATLRNPDDSVITDAVSMTMAELLHSGQQAPVRSQTRKTSSPEPKSIVISYIVGGIR